MPMHYEDVTKALISKLGRNVSQSEIANAINSSPFTISKRAGRNSKFSDDEIKMLEKTFNITIEEPERVVSEIDNKKKLKDIIDEISAEKREKVTREKIGEVFGVSRQRITAMLDKPLPPHRLKQLEDAFCMSISETVEQFGTEEFIKSPEELKNDGFKYLPIRGDVSASCGNGVYVYDESQTAVYPVSEFLLKSLGASLTETDIIFASGDSMLPEIKDGDALMVDKSKKDVIDGQIYIIRSDGQLLCKRLQKIPPMKIKIVSDNQKYDPYYIDFSKVIDFDFEVIGRVLWYSRIAR